MHARASRRLLAALVVAAPTAGCGMLIGVSSWQDVACVEDCGAADSSVTMEAGPDVHPDAPSSPDADAGLDGSSTPDSPSDGPVGEAEAGNPYHSVGDISRWSKFDVSTVSSGLHGFAGGAFDGRYVFMAPHNDGTPDGLVARLDTQADAGFAGGGSWTSFNTASLAASATGYLGAVYDPTHEHLYLVPNNDGVASGTVASYATSQPFAGDASWSTFSTLTLDAGAGGFAGGTFDGKYLYLVPSNNGAPDGVVARLDTTQPFASASSWSTFDLSRLVPAAKGYFGAVYTGTYVIFVPAGGASPLPLVAAFEANQPFSSPSSWLTYDLSGLNAHASGFQGAAFDGQYVYLVPHDNGAPDGIVARYDSFQQFTSQGAWTFYDVTQLSAAATGFAGGAFDGRYVYLVPSAGTLLVRFDTTAPFGTPGSWSTFDLQAQLGSGLGPFEGAVFDGEYLYLVPAGDGLVARFDARSPPALPVGQTGSFL